MNLHTQLEHVNSAAELQEIINSNNNVMICCGRMGPMCIPVYHDMEILRDSYPHVKFMDMAFDHPESYVIKSLPECSGFMGLPFTVYYKNGKVTAATTSIQTREQIKSILDKEFSS